MRRVLFYAASAAILSIGVPQAFAQSGSVEKAVGGYNFEEAAKEAPGTKDFHSADGHLTFAIVTHTAGNGFFDPVYVGATVAGNMLTPVRPGMLYKTRGRSTASATAL